MCMDPEEQKEVDDVGPKPQIKAQHTRNYFMYIQLCTFPWAIRTQYDCISLATSSQPLPTTIYTSYVTPGTKHHGSVLNPHSVAYKTIHSNPMSDQEWTDKHTQKPLGSHLPSL